MKIVQDHKDVIKIGRNSSVIIWGAGKLGTELMCRLNSEEFFNYYVSDTDSEVKKRICNYIAPEDIIDIFKHQCISVILAVRSDDVIKNIKDQIDLLLGSADCNVEIFRYIPESVEEMVARRKEQGFFDGCRYRKTLEDSKAVNVLMSMITGSKPFLFARWGTIEGEVIYKMKVGVQPSTEDRLRLKQNAGVFPVTDNVIKSYYEIMTNAAAEIDILCVFYWQCHLEKWIEWYSHNAIMVSSALEYPFFSIPWTKVLEGMKVLVIHPFASLIREQYKNRDRLFSNCDVLPEFELITYQAVQSLGGNDMYEDWMQALNVMQDDISKIDFDICLIGCGAYGMPLGAFVKSKLHKKAIHMGGSLQLLFGIKGKRWESNGYDYQHKLYNEYWVRPTDDLKPQNYKDVENGCYW
ncbi:MAG: hypothetical protein K2N34_12665 [Lachnospiraceae bacterium]|nr:hypothetical protein [Lachnospiraceae bacterium]